MFECTSLVLPKDKPLARVAIRPLKFRQADFAQRFDARTLFYDVFLHEAGGERSLVLLGPPLWNLLLPLCRAKLGGQRVGTTVSAIYQRDRCCDIWIPNWREEEVQLQLGSDSHVLLSQPAAQEPYRERRVLYTLSKDNDINWIIDWVRFHAVNHGADAVLLYDNGSARYTPQSLEIALRYEFPQFVVNVVDWPYPYGPSGTSGHLWDSDFCQPGAFQDARFRFLEGAASVLNCDIDELVVSASRESVFEAAEASAGGCVSFGGRWISTAVPTSERRDHEPLRRHSQFYLLDAADDGACPSKWCVVPRECHRWEQWIAHAIVGRDLGQYRSADFSYRHFRAISTDWKYRRSAPKPVVPGRNTADQTLLRAFAQAGM
jgi:hypothetical protein